MGGPGCGKRLVLTLRCTDTGERFSAEGCYETHSQPGVHPVAIPGAYSCPIGGRVVAREYSRGVVVLPPNSHDSLAPAWE
jgi:hypothetical protein